MPPKRAVSKPTCPVSAAPPASAQQPITTAEAYFQYLRDLNTASRRSTPVQVNLTKRVVVTSSSKQSTLDRMTVIRKNGDALCLSPAFLACFYDISLNSMLEILDITLRCYRRVKIGLNVPRWPQQAIAARLHPITTQMVRSARLQFMRWAFENSDQCTYSLLYSGHRCAGCKLIGLPLPGSILPPAPAPASSPAEPEPKSEPDPPASACHQEADPPASACDQLADPPQEEDLVGGLPFFDDTGLEDMDWSRLFVEEDGGGSV